MGTLDRLILECPHCSTKVAVPTAARGRKAKCVTCSATFEIPAEDGDLVGAAADDRASEVGQDAQRPRDETTKAMPPLDDEDDLGDEDDDLGDEPVDDFDLLTDEDFDAEEPNLPPRPAAETKPKQDATDPELIAARIEDVAREDPPDIGGPETPAEVKQLRRERHRLLLEIGREGYQDILSSSFAEFQKRIKRTDKAIRRVKAWLDAVRRASTETNNPLLKGMDMNIDPSKKVDALCDLERERNMALRALGEALIVSGRHPKLGAEQRERVMQIEERLEELVPAPPSKKGLLSRFRSK